MMRPAVNRTPDFQRQQHQEQLSFADDELSCKICLGVYSQRSGQRPRTLLCQHTFCESCLQQLTQAPKKSISRLKKQGHPETSAGNVKCPLCKCRTNLGPTSIQGLPVNSTAIKQSAQMSDIRSQFYGRQLRDLQPRSAAKEYVNVKGKSQPQFMSCGTTGTRVVARRFESFHPEPHDEYDIWELSRSRGSERVLRFADDDPMSFDLEHTYYPRHEPAEYITDDDMLDQGDDVFDDDTRNTVNVGQFGEFGDSGPGTFRSPSSIDCASDGRLVIVDTGNDSVQIFARNGDRLSDCRVVGARAACFIGGGDVLAVATNSGVSVCDQTGRVDKHLPIGTDVVAVAALRHGGRVFVAAHRNRITICDSYKPTAVLRSVSKARPLNLPIGQPGMQFSDIVALASTATPRVYVVDGAAVLAVDIDTGTILESISSAECRQLRQPNAVAVDVVTGNVLVCDSATRRVMQFDVHGGRQRCVVQLPDDGDQCVALAAGPRSHDGHQLIYVVCRASGLAQVLMFQI